MMRRPPGSLRALAGTVLAAGLLAGCSGLRSRSAPEQVWVLRPAEAAIDAAAPAAAAAVPAATTPLGSLRVDAPDAAPGLDTDRILLLRPDHRLQTYAGNRWSARTPALVESLAVAALRDSGAWRAVEDSGGRFPTDYRLEIRIRRFEAEYADAGAPQVHVVLFGLLGLRESGRVLASLDAAAVVPAQTNTMTAVVAAFDAASAQALHELVGQAITASRAAPAPASAAASTSSGAETASGAR